jgi:hypothetical protein
VGAVTMPPVRGRAGAATEDAGRTLLVVWIDAREAILVRWADGAASVERLRSDVPAHRRATGNVRHRPDIRHGGGGTPQTAGEPRRLEHLERFVESVMARVAPGEDVLCLGPGTVHERLARQISERNRQRHLDRCVRSEASSRQTRAQLIAGLRRAVGEEPRRHTVGAYRWSENVSPERSGRQRPLPPRVVAGRHHDRRSSLPED